MGLFELLENIRKRPEHFLGNKSIVRLQVFLGGYNYHKAVTGLSKPEEDQIWIRFQRWVAQRYEIKTNQSWMQIILFFSRDEFDALDNFFKLLDEFKQQVSYG